VGHQASVLGLEKGGPVSDKGFMFFCSWWRAPTMGWPSGLPVGRAPYSAYAAIGEAWMLCCCACCVAGGWTSLAVDSHLTTTHCPATQRRGSHHPAMDAKSMDYYWD
jgi:hypothetical protein